MKSFIVIAVTVLAALLAALVVGSIWVARLDVLRTPVPDENDVKPPFFWSRVWG